MLFWQMTLVATRVAAFHHLETKAAISSILSIYQNTPPSFVLKRLSCHGGESA